MYEVRQSICVTGVSRDAVLAVKSLVAGVTSQPLPLESFHVKQRSYVADGAMLVPKVVLAAAHQPGRKFLDRRQAGDGQLDFLYDEVCKIGAHVLLVCVDLPRIVYPPNKSFIFHHRVAELLFGDQPTLQTLALENALITVTAGTGLNHIQRNVVREWLSRPVRRDHKVYRAAAQYLSEAETEAASWSEPDAVWHRRRRTAIPAQLGTGWDQLRRGFQSAVEGRRRDGQPPRRKKKKHSCGRRTTGGDTEERRPLIDAEDEASSTSETQELSIFSDVGGDVMFRPAPRHMLSTTCFVQSYR